MGGIFSSIFNRISQFYGNQEIRLLMLGLDAAGKTTILYRLKLGQVVTTIPTTGFNVETIEYHNLSFNVWDICSQDKYRPLWRHYFENAKGIIFVVDSTDRERIDEARFELHRLFTGDELKDAVLLVLANKQDLDNTMNVDELMEKLELNQLKDRSFWVQRTSAITGVGIYEGLDWLSTELRKKK